MCQQILGRFRTFIGQLSPAAYTSLRLAFYAFLVIGSKLIATIVYQKIFKTPYNRSGSPLDVDGKIQSDYFTDPFALPMLYTLLVFLTCSILYKKDENQIQVEVPWLQYLKVGIGNAFLAVFMMLSMILTSYIVVSVITSCQLIGAVILGAFFSESKEQFKVMKRQIIIAIILCFAIAIYVIFDQNNKKDSVNKPLGWLSGLVFLGMLAIYSYLPEQLARIRDRYSPSALLLSKESSKYSFVFLFVIAVCSTYLWKLAVFVWQHDRIVLDLMIDSSFNAFATIILFKISLEHKQHIGPTMNTVQKLISSLLSAFLYHHNLNAIQFTCIGVVFSIILLDIYLNSQNFDHNHQPPSQTPQLQTEIKQEQMPKI